MAQLPSDPLPSGTFMDAKKAKKAWEDTISEAFATIHGQKIPISADMKLSAADIETLRAFLGPGESVTIAGVEIRANAPPKVVPPASPSGRKFIHD